MHRKVSVGAVAIAIVLLGIVGISNRADAAIPPQPQLVMPQGTAFSILGHDCGGITEYAYVTGFDNTVDPAAGYPTGYINLSTRCGGSGKGGGGGGTTYTAWTADTWDLTGALLSYSLYTSGTPNVDPGFAATDPLTGNQIDNSASPCPGTGGTGSTAYACLQWANSFTPRPRVTGISPTIGPSSGGTSVAISGDGFTAATAVDFGSTAGTVTVNSDNSITATSPTSIPGTVDVTVLSPGGRSFTGTSDQFISYGQPTVTGVSPDSGPVAGGYYVTVSGTHFVGTTGVNAGDTPTAFQVVDDNTLSVYIPGSDSGAGDSIDITVTSPGGTSPITSYDQFTYLAAPPPATVAVSPVKGKPGKRVKATGASFAASETVTVAYITGLSSPNPTSVTICSATTSTAGTFKCKGAIPAAVTAGSPGAHSIVATGTVGDSAVSSFDLK